MKCQSCREHLIAYIEGVLDPGKAEELGRHLEGCAACRVLMEEHASLHARLVKDGEILSQGNMDTRVMDLIFREQTLQARRLRKQVIQRRLFAAAAAAAVIVAMAVLGYMAIDWPLRIQASDRSVSMHEKPGFFDSRTKGHESPQAETANLNIIRNNDIQSSKLQLDEDTRLRLRQLGYGGPAPKPNAASGNASREFMDKFKALGYIGPGSTATSAQGGGIHAASADGYGNTPTTVPELKARVARRLGMPIQTGSKADFQGLGQSTPMPPMLGFSVGGAKDIFNFRKNIENGFLPIPTDITYEGLYYDYYFDTGELFECDDLFYPTYCAAVTRDPFSKRDEYYLTVGMNSGLKSFERKKLNLVVVLDVSGSMKTPINVYHYDRQGGQAKLQEPEITQSPKIQVAKESLLALLEHLKQEDRFGLVIFSDQGSLVQAITSVGGMDMEGLIGRINAFIADGSTNMSSGMDIGIAQLDSVLDPESTDYENRILFITDAQPNQGELSEHGLLGKARANAGRRIYTTFIGIGVDFNSELIEFITKTRGANYYSAPSGDDFRRRMDDEFDFMVSPLVFGLELNLESGGYRIDKVYGSPEADKTTGTLMKVNTLFPSARVDGETRGGVVLLKLSRKLMPKDDEIFLSVKYEDRDGIEHTSSRTIRFAGFEPEHFDNTGIRKAVLLARYANLLKDWLIDMRIREITPAAGGPDQLDYLVSEASGIKVPPPVGPELGQWERMSRPLKVNDHYKALFKEFRTHFEAEMKAINDDTLNQEAVTLEKLAIQ